MSASEVNLPQSCVFVFICPTNGRGWLLLVLGRDAPIFVNHRYVLWWHLPAIIAIAAANVHLLYVYVGSLRGLLCEPPAPMRLQLVLGHGGLSQ